LTFGSRIRFFVSPRDLLADPHLILAGGG